MQGGRAKNEEFAGIEWLMFSVCMADPRYKKGRRIGDAEKKTNPVIFFHYPRENFEFRCD